MSLLGTAFQWKMIGLPSTWDFSMSSVQIRMVCIVSYVIWVGLNIWCKVPVIAVFTKYDQFKRDVKMKLVSRSMGNASMKDVKNEAEKIFQEQYWSVIKGSSPRYVRLESKVHYHISPHLVGWLYLVGMHKVGEPCGALITETANALNPEVVTLMLLAVQRGNLEMSVKMAMRR